MHTRNWIAKGAILSLFLLTLIASPLMAQSQNISGTVVDESGAVIPGAEVKITDVAKGTLLVKQAPMKRACSGQST